jgi:putative ABC transport system substrate-binding protein
VQRQSDVASFGPEAWARALAAPIRGQPRGAILHVKRRGFITLLGGAAAAWPQAAWAQPAGKLPTIGYLGTSSAAASSRWVASFVKRLRELGWIEGRTVAIEYRWAEGHSERFSEMVAEFVRLKVDTIVTSSSGAIAAKQLTTLIPVVFTLAQDPVGSGLVVSLARPGGNITGLSNQEADLAGKRIELLREVVPGLHRLAVLANDDNVGAAREMEETQIAANKLGFQIISVPIHQADDISPALERLAGQADALFVVGDVLQTTHRIRINTLALGLRLPTMLPTREDVEVAGLMSYGTNFADQFRRAAEIVDKILRGTKPGDIPVEQPTKFELVVNLTTAKALGLTIPESFLWRADEVIE